MADFGGIRPALRGRGLCRGSASRLAASAVCVHRHKASSRKAARLRELRLCFIRPRRRKAAIPPALHSLPLPFESPSGMQKEMTVRWTVISFWLKIAISTK